MGTLDRLLTGVANGEGGRYVAWDNLDTCVAGLPGTLSAVEAEQLADRITVVRRDGAVLYDNELVAGTWQRRTAADRSVVYEWRRPWSARETATFNRDLAQAEVRVRRDLPEDERLAVHRDVGRAAALAEPVRRIAQPRRQSPGLDYHQLSNAEHRWVFDELIAPSYLRGIITRKECSGPVWAGTPALCVSWPWGGACGAGWRGWGARADPVICVPGDAGCGVRYARASSTCLTRVRRVRRASAAGPEEAGL